MSLPLFSVTFARSSVDIDCDSGEAFDFLTLLLGEVSTIENSGSPPHRLSLLMDSDRSHYLLYSDQTLLLRGQLDVRFAAHLYDTVIFHLLNESRNGVALHAGAVVCGDKTVLLPGLSGAGKSTVTAWLISRGCTYLTDELIFLGIDDDDSIEYFKRPLCLKPGSLHLIDELLHDPLSTDLLLDDHGAVIPHRLINETNSVPKSHPACVILPEYRTDADPMLETISTARLATILMGCHVNARNLVDHGFKQILELARAATAHRLRYSSLKSAEPFMDTILYGQD